MGGADPERLGDLRRRRLPGHRGGAAVHERVGRHHRAGPGGRSRDAAGAPARRRAPSPRPAGVAVASVLLNSAPFFVALGARIWLSEHLTRRQVLGLVVGFGGIVLIVASQGGSSGSSVAAGIVVCMAGSLGWAAAGLAMRHLSTRTPGFDVYGASTAQFLCGGVLLIPYLIVARPTPTQWSSAELWASLAFLVVGAQVITYVGFY